MSLQLTIIFNAALAVVLIGGLAFLLEKPRRLEPHVRGAARRTSEEPARIEAAGGRAPRPQRRQLAG